MNRRILSLILSLAMVLTCFAGMMTVPSYAGSYSTQYVNNIAELKAALESGNRIIILNKDIEETLKPSPEDVWVTTSGTIVLDLNGHKLKPWSTEAFSSTLIQIPEDSQMVVCSSKAGGLITYLSDIPGNGALKYRNIFRVFGTLIVNSGNVEAGRSTRDYSAYYAKYIYRQTYGSAITMMGSSKVVINGGNLAGRGYDVPVIRATNTAKGSQLIINNANMKGFGSANLLAHNNLVDIQIRAMEGECQKLNAIKIDGKSTVGYDKGHSGIQPSFIDLDVTDYSYKGNSLPLAYEVKVTPRPVSDEKWTFNNNAPRGMYLTLARDNAIVKADLNAKNGYWQTPDFGCDMAYYGAPHRFGYVWTLTQNGQFITNKTIVSEGSTTGNFLDSINLEKDFNVFFETGQCFQLSCSCVEYMGSAFRMADSYEYSVIVVTDVDAPVISENPMTNVIYSEGQTVTLSGKAEGSHVLYKWQYFEPGETVAKDLYIDGKLVDTPVLELKNLTKADSGKSYRLEAHNSAGNVYSTTATIIARNATIYPQITDLDAPMHGIPLDMTASTPSVGCKVTKVSWSVVSGDVLDSSYVPYAGQTLVCEVTVEAEEGFNLSGPAEIKAWNKKNFSTSIPTVTSRCFSFMVDVAAPQGGVHIDSLKLQGLGDPSPEKNLTAATVIETGFGDTFARDVRYSVFGGSAWYCNDQKVQIPFLENFEVGSIYRLEVTITPQNGYYVDVDTIVTIDDQPMEVRPSGGKIIASIEYPMIEEKTMPFTDVPQGSYYYDAVLWAFYAEPQITDGMSTTLFGTGKTCTRGQVVTFLWRTAGCPEPKSLNNPFTDVKSSDYFYKPVLWAVEQGITDGTAPDKFSPANPCKNSHILTFIWRAVGKPEDNGNAVWYQDAYNWANKNGLLTGTYTGSFDVNAACPRENVVTYLYRYNKL